MGTVRKVLILSIKAGAGHLRAAQALEQAFAEKYPEVELLHLDALEYTNAAFRKSFTEGYERLAKDLPSVWGLLYESLEEKPANSAMKKLARMFDDLNSRPLRKAVKEFDPDRVICTHYMPAEVMGPRRLKGKLRAPVYVTLTDYDIHTMWIQDGVDHYCVATDEMAYALEAKGIGNAKAHVTGIPILPMFSQKYPPKADLRRQLGLRADAPTVLLSAGGFGLIRVDQIAAALADRVPDVQFLAVAGKNQKLHHALLTAAEGREDKIKPFGFVNNMHELMAASDFAVAKSGGLTVTESLAMGLPMVVIKPIPGQEERNATYLLENGAAVWAHSPAYAVYKTEILLRDEKKLAKMQRAAKKLAKPKAADTIADLVMQPADGDGE